MSLNAFSIIKSVCFNQSISMRSVPRLYKQPPPNPGFGLAKREPNANEVLSSPL